MSLDTYYTQRVYFVSPTTSTTWGNESGFSTAGTTFWAAINPSRGTVRIAGGKETKFADAKLFCSATVALVEKCGVRAGRTFTTATSSASTGAWSYGTTYDVAFVKNTLARGHHKLVYLVDRRD